MTTRKARAFTLIARAILVPHLELSCKQIVIHSFVSFFSVLHNFVERKLTQTDVHHYQYGRYAKVRSKASWKHANRDPPFKTAAHASLRKKELKIVNKIFWCCSPFLSVYRLLWYMYYHVTIERHLQNFEIRQRLPKAISITQSTNIQQNISGSPFAIGEKCKQVEDCTRAVIILERNRLSTIRINWSKQSWYIPVFM